MMKTWSNGHFEKWKRRNMKNIFCTVSYSGSHNANMANGHMVNIAHSEKWKEELSNCAQVELFFNFVQPDETYMMQTWSPLQCMGHMVNIGQCEKWKRRITKLCAGRV